MATNTTEANWNPADIVKRKRMHDSLTKAIGELRIANGLYTELFPNGLPTYHIDLKAISDEVVKARKVIQEAGERQ